MNLLLFVCLAAAFILPSLFVLISFLLIGLSVSLFLCMFLLSPFSLYVLHTVWQSLYFSSLYASRSPLFTVYAAVCRIYYNLNIGQCSLLHIDARSGERCEFVGVLLLCTCVSKCMCMLMCVWLRAWHVCVDHGGIPQAICTGPVRLWNCLWVWGCSQCSGPLAQISHSQNS